jgi:hypothetical protein
MNTEQEIDWDNFKCRCSAISSIMSNSRGNGPITPTQQQELGELEGRDKLTPRQTERLAELRLKAENSKEIVLSDTCIGYLIEEYSRRSTGKLAIGKELDIAYTRKGKLVEDDSIVLLSIVEGVVYEKNDERVENDYLSGEPDIYVGTALMQATKITDIKSCWDYPTFLKKTLEGLDKGYESQIQGYMDISGAREGEVAYCLVNMPEMMINDYKRKLFYQGEYVTEESPAFLEKWLPMLRSMIFDDIPHHQRVFKQKIEPFTEEKRQQVYDRVKACREWLWKFDETVKNLNK